jgi:hypothetical protein
MNGTVAYSLQHARRVLSALLAQLALCLMVAPALMAQDAPRSEPARRGAPVRRSTPQNGGRQSLQASIDSSNVRTEEDSKTENRKGARKTTPILEGPSHIDDHQSQATASRHRGTGGAPVFLPASAHLRPPLAAALNCLAPYSSCPPLRGLIDAHPASQPTGPPVV